MPSTIDYGSFTILRGLGEPIGPFSCPIVSSLWFAQLPTRTAWFQLLQRGTDAPEIATCRNRCVHIGVTNRKANGISRPQSRICVSFENNGPVNSSQKQQLNDVSCPDSASIVRATPRIEDTSFQDRTWTGHLPAVHTDKMKIFITGIYLCATSKLDLI